jgi:uncharacterized protein YfbU (UPF0304 family)
MEFTNEQKLIVALLTDIHAALKIKDGLDPMFVQDKVCSGRTWALRWQYSGLFHDDEETPEDVKFVAKVLDLWERLERSFDSLSDAQKAQLVELSPVYGANVRFSGFDGNGGDRDGLGTTHVLVEEMGRWSIFKGRDFNAHAHMSGVYERMIEASKALGKGPADYWFSLEEIAQVLNASPHPNN